MLSEFDQDESLLRLNGISKKIPITCRENGTTASNLILSRTEFGFKDAFWDFRGVAQGWAVAWALTHMETLFVPLPAMTEVQIEIREEARRHGKISYRILTVVMYVLLRHKLLPGLDGIKSLNRNLARKWRCWFWKLRRVFTFEFAYSTQPRQFRGLPWCSSTVPP